MGAPPQIPVEVVYATTRVQAVVALSVPAGATVAEVIRTCGILQRFPEIDLTRQRVGIYGVEVSLDAGVAAHDRIEIYRPLIVDPKQMRRARAARSRPRRGQRS